MTPDGHNNEQPAVSPPAPVKRAKPAWFRRLASVIFVVFCLEIGLVLMIYPWTDAWGENYFAWLGTAAFQHRWHEVWMTGYLRGAVTGFGLLNIWLAIAEALRMYIGSPDNK